MTCKDTPMCVELDSEGVDMTRLRMNENMGVNDSEGFNLES